MKSMLVYGGTGIIGQAIEKLAPNYDITFIGIKNVLKLKKKDWDVILHIYTFGEQDYFKDCGHIIIMSTALVYDRSKYTTQRITTKHPISPIGIQGAYVDHKIQLEKYWQESKFNWTILRPYHILGPGSYLGCIPPHNRDPQLIKKIKSGEIELCDGGRIPINVTHPSDIGQIMIKCANNPRTFRKVYNAVNPTEIIARDYYLKIAQVLDVDLKIKNKSGEKCWGNDWQLTTLPHMYDVVDLEDDVGFIPTISLEKCINDALDHHPSNRFKGKEIAVHKRMNKLPLPIRHSYFSET